MPTMTTRSLGGRAGAKKRKVRLSNRRSTAASGEAGAASTSASATDAARIKTEPSAIGPACLSLSGTRIAWHLQ